jgi:AcrR family transcriptional regulator
MPKKTFFNLDKKKREKFLKACFEEFSAHEYNSASVSLIVKELEIAKGSVYQYFENKKDLFFYLVDIATEEKEKFLADFKPDNYKSFFNWISADLEAKFKFEKEKALISKFLDNFYLQKNNPELREKYIKVRHKEYNAYLNAVKNAGDVFRKKTEAEKVAVLLMKLDEISVDYSEIISGKKMSAKSKAGISQEVAEGFLDLIKSGVNK